MGPSLDDLESLTWAMWDTCLKLRIWQIASKHMDTFKSYPGKAWQKGNTLHLVPGAVRHWSTYVALLWMYTVYTFSQNQGLLINVWCPGIICVMILAFYNLFGLHIWIRTCFRLFCNAIPKRYTKVHWWTWAILTWTSLIFMCVSRHFLCVLTHKQNTAYISVPCKYSFMCHYYANSINWSISPSPGMVKIYRQSQGKIIFC